MFFAILFTLVIVAGAALRIAVPYLSGEVAATGIVQKDGESVLGDCPSSPNCQGSESSRSTQTVDRFPLSDQVSNQVNNQATEAIATLANIVETYPGTKIITQDERYLHATFASKLMGYIDDVEFLVSDDQQSVQVRSASRLGESDLGANKKRVDALRSSATGKL